jgi:hypothetical protein
MKKRRVLFLALLILASFPVATTGNAQSLLNGPQKIVIDASRNRLLVSNGNNGAIVQIDSTGKQSYFLQNGGFIDGLEIVGDTVYGVGDNRKLLAYNLITKQKVLEVSFTGSAGNYLSSVTSDSAGHLFISCPYLNEIYKFRLSDRRYWIFAKNNGLNKPNGILLEKEKKRIVVIDDSPPPALIHAISLTDSTVTTLISTTFNSPDGITRDKYGYHYMGGYYLSGLYKTDADFSYAPVNIFTGTSMVYPTYDPKTHSLLITHYNTNTWRRVPLISTGIVTDVESNDFTILPVFPNPTDTGVTINFELNRNAFVTLDIVNSAGTLIKSMLNQDKNAGNYSLKWNGTDHQGNPAAKGVYYIRITIDGKTQTQKAILAK